MTDDTTPQSQPDSRSDGAHDASPVAPAADAAAPERRRSRKRIVWISSLTAGVLVLGGAGTAWALSEDGDDALTGDALDRASEVALAEVGDGTVTDAERRDEGGFELEVTQRDGRETDVLLDGDYEVIAVDAGDSTALGGTSRDDDASDAGATDRGDDADDAPGALAPLTDDEIARAGAAALAETGGGEVVDVDRSDDADSAFEIEVRLGNGDEVDVELDDSFTVVRSAR